MARRSICVDRTNKSLCDIEIIAGTGTGIGIGQNEDDDAQKATPVLATKVFLYGVSEKWKELIQSAVNGKIFIPQISREIIDNIITYIYAEYTTEPQPLAIDDENLGKYWRAANFLQMEDIKAECLKYFDSKTITLDNFSVLFKWLPIFGPATTKPKMTTFLTQNPHQIPEIIRRCKSELEIPESELSGMIMDWLPSSGGESCGLDVAEVTELFSSKDEKVKLLEAFHKAGGYDWKETAFVLIVNLCKSGDPDSDEVQNPTVPNPQSGCSSNTTIRTSQSNSNSTPKTILPLAASSSVSVSSPSTSTSKSLSFSRGPSKTIPSKSGTNSNSNSNLSSRGCQSIASASTSASGTTPKCQLRPAKKPRRGNSPTSTRSSLNVTVANVEREHSPAQQEEEMEVDSDNSSSSVSSLGDSKIQRKRILEKNNKLAQNVPPQGKVYFLLKNKNGSGGNHFWSFDLKTRKFGQEAQMPPSFRDRRNFAMIYWKEEIYFMGGESCETGKVTKEVHVFNLKSPKWTKMEMLDPRYDFQACVLNGDIYAVGGCEEGPGGPTAVGIGINTVEMLSFPSRKSTGGDSSSGATWKHAGWFMNSCRADAGIVSLDGKMYAIGGFVRNKKVGKNMSASELCEVFDPKIRQPKKDQWNPIAPMKFKRLGLAAVATTNPNRIYALGGTLKSPSENSKLNPQPMNTVEIYDPDEDSWTTGPPMNKARKFFSAVYANNCVYALGGDSDAKPTMEKFDLLKREWSLEGDLKKYGNYATVAFKPK